ncbi:hypothetical protein INT43_000494 [Umbelopsis isabellina]|uniref:PHD-type domain-containing protein n=1 Tax=Mortierella isabellina TaxID=91625 RepID=A0A8H7Q2Z2_MORIS|nr:hypothetical protein INT43_000494 [Umbelopsis isabellina]
MPLREVLSPLNSESVLSKNVLSKVDSSGKASDSAHSPSKEKTTAERKKRTPAKRTKKSKQHQEPVTDENQNLFLEPGNVEHKELLTSPLVKRLQAVDNVHQTPKKRRKTLNRASPNSAAVNTPTNGRKVFGGKSVTYRSVTPAEAPKYSSSELKNMSRRYEDAQNGTPLTPKRSLTRTDSSSLSSIILTPKRPTYTQRNSEPKSPLAHRQRTLSPLSSPALEAVDLSKLMPQPTKPLLFQTCHKIWPRSTSSSMAIQDVKPLTLMLKERLGRAKNKILAQQEEAIIRYTIPQFSHTTHKAGDADTTVGNAKNFFARIMKNEHERITSRRAMERKQFVEATKSALKSIPNNDFKAVELVTDSDGRMSLALTPKTKLKYKRKEKHTGKKILSALADDIPSCPSTPSPKSKLANGSVIAKCKSGDSGYMCVNCHNFYKNKRGLNYHIERCKFKNAPKTIKHLIAAVDNETTDEERSEDDEWRDAVTDCICTTQSDDAGPMVQCDRCESWLHLDCVGLNEDSLEEEYYCPRCNGEYASPPSSCHRSTGGKTVAGALDAQLKLQARLRKIKAKQTGNRSLLDRFVQEANNAYLETRLKQRMLNTPPEEDESDDDTYDPNLIEQESDSGIDTQSNEQEDSTSTPTHTVHVWEGFSLNVSPHSQHVWGSGDTFELSQASDFLLDDEALNATLAQEAAILAPLAVNNDNGTTVIDSNHSHTATPAEMVALSLKQQQQSQPPSSDIYMGSLIDDDDVGTSFASPMTDGDDRHWNPIIKASPYLYMDDASDITPFALKMGEAGYFDLANLPLDTTSTAPDASLDSWLVTGDNGELGVEVVEQDFDGLINLDA